MKAATTTLVLCVAGLLALGMVALDSVSMARPQAHYLSSQIVWCGLGLVSATIAACIDYRKLKPLTPWILGVAMVLLVLVLIPHVGKKINGARRWLLVGQPSEVAKLALILFLAAYGDYCRRQMRSLKDGLLIPGAVASLVLLLVFVEPDRGTTILLAAMTCVLLLLAGTRVTFIVPPILLGAAGLAFSLWHDPIRRERILAFLHPELHKEGAGLQTWQSMLALGAGHWTGLGLGNGLQKNGYIPEQQTDFIFSALGEELGLVATLGVILAFVVLVFCGLKIARQAADRFGFLLAAGITFLIGLQAAINIAVVTGSVPNKGLPLPFVSYGGSSLLVMLTAVGLLVSVARHAGEGALESDASLHSEELSPAQSP